MAQYNALRPTNPIGTAIVLELDTYLDTDEYDLTTNYAIDGRLLFEDTWMAVGAALNNGLQWLYLNYNPSTDGQEWGFIWSIDSLHMLENAYYDGTWKSLETGHEAVVLQTSALTGYAFRIKMDENVTAADQALTWVNLLDVGFDGTMNLLNTDNDPIYKLEKEGTNAGSASIVYNSADASLDFYIE